MLKRIRQNMKTFSIPLWIVAASFVGTIFLVWGRGSVTGPSGNEVATVNGKGIDLISFNREYNNIVSRLRSQYGENFRKLFPEEQIKMEALRRLITRTLLLQEAENEGLKVSDWAVAKEIESMPAFQKDNKFSVELYKQFLKARRLNAHTFEEMVREDLLIQKLLTVVDHSASVTDFELKKLYIQNFGKRRFKYKEFNLKDFSPKVSDEEVEKYYQNHKDEFSEKTGEKYFLIEIPKSNTGAAERAKKAFNLARNGKIKELEEFNPQEVKDKNLIQEKFKNRPFGFYSSEKAFYVFFKKSGKRVKPLSEVKDKIREILRKEKAVALAQKAAEEFIKSNRELNSTTEEISKQEFFTKFKPLNPLEVESLYTLNTGKKTIIRTAQGFGIFQPITEIKVDKFDEKKMKELKDLILSIKNNSNYMNLLDLLQQKATVKINNQFFKKGEK